MGNRYVGGTVNLSHEPDITPNRRLWCARPNRPFRACIAARSRSTDGERADTLPVAVVFSMSVDERLRPGTEGRHDHGGGGWIGDEGLGGGHGAPPSLGCDRKIKLPRCAAGHSGSNEPHAPTWVGARDDLAPPAARTVHLGTTLDIGSGDVRLGVQMQMIFVNQRRPRRRSHDVTKPHASPCALGLIPLSANRSCIGHDRRRAGPLRLPCAEVASRPGEVPARPHERDQAAWRSAHCRFCPPTRSVSGSRGVVDASASSRCPVSRSSSSSVIETPNIRRGPMTSSVPRGLPRCQPVSGRPACTPSSNSGAGPFAPNCRTAR